jgi:hypothetical protein
MSLTEGVVGIDEIYNKCIIIEEKWILDREKSRKFKKIQENFKKAFETCNSQSLI